MPITADSLRLRNRRTEEQEQDHIPQVLWCSCEERRRELATIRRRYTMRIMADALRLRNRSTKEQEQDNISRVLWCSC